MEIKDIQVLVKSSMSLIGDLCDLLFTEARLAGKSVVALCCVLIFIVILMGSTWLCGLGALFLLLMAIGLPALSAFIILVLFNIFLIIMMLCLAKSYQKNLEFSATRRQLATKS